MGGKDSKPVFVTYEDALDRGITYPNLHTAPNWSVRADRGI